MGTFTFHKRAFLKKGNYFIFSFSSETLFVNVYQDELLHVFLCALFLPILLSLIADILNSMYSGPFIV